MGINIATNGRAKENVFHHGHIVHASLNTPMLRPSRFKNKLHFDGHSKDFFFKKA
jgi:hypothetical protein